MFRNKKDVDRHVQEIFSKLKTEKERNLRSLAVSKLYIDIGDFEVAKKYVCSFLSEKEDDWEARKILGRCFESCGDNIQALEQYKQSLKHHPRQPEIILKVCTLLCNPEITIHKEEASTWLEKGKSYFPNHPAMLQLKARIQTITGKIEANLSDTTIFENGKVKNVKFCVQILSSYVDSGKTKDAYAFLTSVENQNFGSNVDWYDCCAKIYKSYEAKYSHDLSADFYERYFYARERFVACCLMEVGVLQRKTMTACVSALAAFDELLIRARDYLKESAFADHMSAQYCFHAATLLCWKSKWVDDDWKECMRSIVPLMKLCCVVDYSEGRNDKGGLDGACTLDAKYRNMQAKYMLRILEGNRYGLEAANWRTTTCSQLYFLSEWKPFRKSSYLCRDDDAFFEKTPQFSIVGDDSGNAVAEYVEVLKKLRPGSLHHSVWLGLQALRSCNEDALPVDFRAGDADGLPFSSQKLSSVSLESLCQLDADAFLYITVFCAKSMWNADNADYFRKHRPIILPADVSDALTTTELDEWWMAAYRCGVKAVPSYGMAEAKSCLLRGLRVVRLLPESNLDGRLLAKIGRTFARRAEMEECAERAEALRHRAVSYWEAAIPALKKMREGGAATIAAEEERYFDYKEKMLENGELDTLVKDGILFLGGAYMETGRLESADKILSQLPNDNWAALFRGKIRLEMAKEKIGKNEGGGVVGERQIAAMLAQGKEFLKKAVAGMVDEESDGEQVAHMFLRMIDELSKVYPFTEEPSNEKSARVKLTPKRGKANLDRSILLDYVSPRAEKTDVNQKRLEEMLEGNGKRLEDILEGNRKRLEDILEGNRKRLEGILERNGEKMNEITRKLGEISLDVADLKLGTKTGGATELKMGLSSSAAAAAAPDLKMGSSSSTAAVTTELKMKSPSAAAAVTELKMGSLPAAAEPVKSEPTNVQWREIEKQASFLPQDNSVIFRGAAIAIGPAAPNFIEKAKEAIDFSALSQKAGGEGTAFVKRQDFKGFEGAGSLVFNWAPATTTTTTMAAAVKSSLKVGEGEPKTPEGAVKSGGVEDDFVPTAEFAPVIPLPDLVEVKTGEEDLEVLYEERCKLLRFANKEWKERGIGKMRILRDPKDGSIRLLMRREQVHKLCCNQRLSMAHELKPVVSSDKAWSWFAQDFSEGELKDEMFAVRFKNSELANAFKTAFEDAKERLPSDGNRSGVKEVVAALTLSKKGNEEGKPLPKLSEMFKAPVGAWDCSVCYIRNVADAKACVACSTANPKAAATTATTCNDNNDVETPKKEGGSSSDTPSPPLVKVNSDGGEREKAEDQMGFAACKGISEAAKMLSPFAKAKDVDETVTGDMLTFNSPMITKKKDDEEVNGNGSENSVEFVNVTKIELTAEERKLTKDLRLPENFYAHNHINKQNCPGCRGCEDVIQANEHKEKETVVVSETPAAPLFGTPVFDGNSSSYSSSVVNATGGGSMTPQTYAMKEFSFGSFAPAATTSANSASSVSTMGSSTTPTTTKTEATKEFSFGSFTPAATKTEAAKEFSFGSFTPAATTATKTETAKEFSFGSFTPAATKTEATKEFSFGSFTPAATKTEAVKEFSFGSFAPAATTFANLASSVNTMGSSTMTTKTDAATKEFSFGSFGSAAVSFADLASSGTTFASAAGGAASFAKNAREEDGAVDEGEHDPHFEPIVPLPDLIDVKSGEEEEDVLFSSRCKLFRWDDNTREWKERGLGNIKVLHHPAAGTYRLLLRREQVHKVVLNQRVTAGLILQPLTTNLNAWCWYGMNFPEGGKEAKLEKLAAKFKTEDIAQEFFNAVSDAVAAVEMLGNISGQGYDGGSNVSEIDETEEDDANALDLADYEVVNEPFCVYLDGVLRFLGKEGGEIRGRFQLTLCHNYDTLELDVYEPRATTVPLYTIRVGELEDGRVDSTIEFNLETLRKEMYGGKLVMEDNGVQLKLDVKREDEIADFCSELDRCIELLESKGFRK